MLCIQNKNWLRDLVLTTNHLSSLTEQSKWKCAQETLWRWKLKPRYAQEFRLLYVSSKHHSSAARQASGPLWLVKQGFMSLCIPWRINDCSVSVSLWLDGECLDKFCYRVLKSEGICERMCFQTGKSITEGVFCQKLQYCISRIAWTLCSLLRDQKWQV